MENSGGAVTPVISNAALTISLGDQPDLKPLTETVMEWLTSMGPE